MIGLELDYSPASRMRAVWRSVTLVLGIAQIRRS